MPVYIWVCILTTGIAFMSIYSSSWSRVQKRLLPWTGGMLFGIGVFWVLPEIAESRSWFVALGSVLPLALLLAWVDHFVYPICPFCAESCRSGFLRNSTRICWPLLVVGCMHSFMDGSAIPLAAIGSAGGPFAALAYGVILHKIPESMAIGIVAARVTPDRIRAIGAVALIQGSMLAGSVLSTFSSNTNVASMELFSIPACAFLLLFAVLALEAEWRLNGGFRAIRAAAPGMIGCGLAALAARVLLP